MKNLTKLLVVTLIGVIGALGVIPNTFGSTSLEDSNAHKLCNAADTIVRSQFETIGNRISCQVDSMRIVLIEIETLNVFGERLNTVIKVVFKPENYIYDADGGLDFKLKTLYDSHVELMYFINPDTVIEEEV